MGVVTPVFTVLKREVFWGASSRHRASSGTLFSTFQIVVDGCLFWCFGDLLYDTSSTREPPDVTKTVLPALMTPQTLQIQYFQRSWASRHYKYSTSSAHEAASGGPWNPVVTFQNVVLECYFNFFGDIMYGAWVRLRGCYVVALASQRPYGVSFYINPTGVMACGHMLKLLYKASI